MTRRRRWRRRSTSSSPTTSPATATRALEVVRHLIAAGHDVHVVIGAPEFVFTTEIKSPNLHIRKAFLRHLRIYRGGRVKLLILDNVSGIIRPSRMTLLLGPPSSGKTTLLLALAGRLGPGLKMSGNITYNGHHLNEFVPQRTSTYVSQQDWHASEMTVRETLEFAGRCQGVGIKYDMLVELLRREKNAGIKPDEDFDVFMKAFALEGKQTSLVAEYNEAKILGLDICADTIVGDEMIKGIYGGQKKRLTTGYFMLLLFILGAFGAVTTITPGRSFTKGNLYTYRRSFLSSMSGIDLSGNSLSGEIPWELGNLNHIKALNLSYNFFTGPIPASFANMSEIESMDLSHNELSGQIPWQLTQLSTLEVFSVAYNNLSGCAPNTGVSSVRLIWIVTKATATFKRHRRGQMLF